MSGKNENYNPYNSCFYLFQDEVPYREIFFDRLSEILLPCGGILVGFRSVCVFPFLLYVMMMMIIIAIEDKGNCKWDFLLVVVPSMCVHMLM